MAFLTGTLAADNLSGSGEDDIIAGLAGNDTIQGLAGNDNINGNQGDDVMFGGAGNETLHGGKGNDIIVSGAGNDILWGDRGSDTLTGGTGNDVFVLDNRETASFNLAEADVITDFRQGSAAGEPNNGFGRDLLGLTEGLTFNDVYIYPGSGTYSNDLIIQDKLTGKYFAVLEGYTDRTVIGSADFASSIIAGITVQSSSI